ncbi:MAG: hypothetical protein IPH06_06805 [Alphaproteobacteria bacterium]|jgi:hypothetical protein|nr:hypothetical protein [Alphaproteobacteria bacterium]QQS57725.1 MAG: hypothetical protein IPN28_02570 [Alphaproteobacteria bacterium]
MKHNEHGDHNAGGVSSSPFGQCFIVDPGLRRGDGWVRSVLPAEAGIYIF